MPDKPNLTFINTTPRDALPMKSLDDFKQWILHDNVKPSLAVSKLMGKYNCLDIHVTTVVELLNLAYPDIDIDRGGFRFRIIDSAYPNSDPKQFSDNDFDDGLTYLRSHPLEQGPNAIETIFRSFKEFETWISEDNKNPSIALRKFMEKYHLLDTSTVLQFLVAVYPNIALYNSDLELRIMESRYPLSDPKQFSDSDLDKGIEALLENTQK